jgi:hypothetical protein
MSTAEDKLLPWRAQFPSLECCVHLVLVKRSTFLCFLIAMIVGASGCHKKKMSAQACQRETASLVALFRSVDSGPALIRPDKLELVQRPAVPATMARPSFAVYVSPQEMRLDTARGTKVVTIDALPGRAMSRFRTLPDRSNAGSAAMAPLTMFGGWHATWLCARRGCQQRSGRTDGIVPNVGAGRERAARNKLARTHRASVWLPAPPP